MTEHIANNCHRTNTVASKKKRVKSVRKQGLKMDKDKHCTNMHKIEKIVLRTLIFTPIQP